MGNGSIGYVENLDIYLTRMSKSMLDKIFFVDKIFDESVTTLIDYGCADGTLLQYVKMFMPDFRLIGYDISDDMLRVARSKNRDIAYYNDFYHIICDPSKTIINMCSLIHEVYSYGNYRTISDFWNHIRDMGFKYLIIRDMTYLDNYAKQDIDYNVIKTILNSKYGDQFKEFCNIWGLNSQKDLIHFLLKYRYIENWNREVHENYFPISLETLKAKLEDNYDLEYERLYTLPYTRWQIKQDFGYDIKDNITHAQLIYKLK